MTNTNLPASSGLASDQRGLGEIAVHETGALAAVSRETSEIHAAMTLAKTFPRDELSVFAGIARSCDRPGFASRAAYSFPRGGKNVTGPSVYMARELARLWRNIHVGIEIVMQTRDEVHIRGWAFDLEANVKQSFDDRFRKQIQRKGRDGETRWVEPDERDLRELINKRGAICVRNSILSLLPADIVEEALSLAERTNQKAASGDLRARREDTLRALVVTFADLGVTQAMIEERLGHALQEINETELADLRKAFLAIQDDAARREEYFTPTTAKASSKGKGKAAKSVADVKAALADEKPAKSDEPEPEVAPTDDEHAADAFAPDAEPGPPADEKEEAPTEAPIGYDGEYLGLLCKLPPWDEWSGEKLGGSSDLKAKTYAELQAAGGELVKQTLSEHVNRAVRVFRKNQAPPLTAAQRCAVLLASLLEDS